MSLEIVDFPRLPMSICACFCSPKPLRHHYTRLPDNRNHVSRLDDRLVRGQIHSSLSLDPCLNMTLPPTKKRFRQDSFNHLCFPINSLHNRSDLQEQCNVRHSQSLDSQVLHITNVSTRQRHRLIDSPSPTHRQQVTGRYGVTESSFKFSAKRQGRCRFEKLVRYNNMVK